MGQTIVLMVLICMASSAGASTCAIDNGPGAQEIMGYATMVTMIGLEIADLNNERSDKRLGIYGIIAGTVFAATAPYEHDDAAFPVFVGLGEVALSAFVLARAKRQVRELRVEPIIRSVDGEPAPGLALSLRF